MMEKAGRAFRVRLLLNVPDKKTKIDKTKWVQNRIGRRHKGQPRQEAAKTHFPASLPQGDRCQRKNDRRRGVFEGDRDSCPHAGRYIGTLLILCRKIGQGDKGHQN